MFATTKVNSTLMESVLRQAWNLTAWTDRSMVRAIVLAGDDLLRALRELDHPSAFGAPVCVFLVASVPVGQQSLLASGALARALIATAQECGLEAVAMTGLLPKSVQLSGSLHLESPMGVCCAIAVGYPADRNHDKMH